MGSICVINPHIHCVICTGPIPAYHLVFLYQRQGLLTFHAPVPQKAEWNQIDMLMPYLYCMDKSGKLFGEALVIKTKEVSSILTSDRLDRVTSINNRGLFLTIES